MIVELKTIKNDLAKYLDTYSYIDTINEVIKELEKPLIDKAPQAKDFMPIEERETAPNTLISIGTLNINSEYVASELIKKIYPPTDED